MSLTLFIKLSRAKKIFFLFLKILPICYPFLVYYFIGSPFLCNMAILLILVMAVANFLANKDGKIFDRVVLFQSLGIGIAVLLCYVIKPSVLHLAYPVLMSLGTMFGFLYTLANPPSMIEKMMRKSGKKIDACDVAYARKLTKVWVGFCGINALFSATAITIGNVKIWLLYNGMISYVLMGMLIIADIGYRYFVKRKSGL